MSRCVILMLSAFACHMFADDMTAGDSLDLEIQALKESLKVLTRQVMMQQLENEERVRSEGDSGVKMVRLKEMATNPYLTTTFSRNSINSIHDHSNNIRTVGMGEIIAVLNGLEFRTRHNDYRLYMPHTTSTGYHEVEDIPFPDVPPEVTGTPEQQIEEMRLWFKAFKEQNYTTRDYRAYFKPVLCYLEGSWTQSDETSLDEPFSSDRHFIDAHSWFELHEKIAFTSATGSKNIGENLAFLPTKIAAVDENSLPSFAQWNYRIMCHPLTRDLPLNRFRAIDDFAHRMQKEYAMPQQEKTRAARYQLNPLDTDEWPDEDFTYDVGLLDELMYEIPGKDNYPASYTDKIFGQTSKRPSQLSSDVLNGGYYHRKYKVSSTGAMGLKEFYRGFNDQNLFVAFNTQNKTMASSYTQCRWGSCTTEEAKVSYAIPLEIIYLSPLYKWNPYNIPYRGTKGDPGTEVVTASNTRNGGDTPETAFDGTHSKIFYQTPYDFFAGGGEVQRDRADTAGNFRHVLDSGGNMHKVTASGTRVMLPAIGDLGTIRLRYPIVPVHSEGSVARKEMEAVKKAFLELGDYKTMLRKPIGTEAKAEPGDTILRVETSLSGNVPPHTHEIIIKPHELLQLLNDRVEITKDTSISEDHMHTIRFKYWSGDKVMASYSCNGGSWKCWDEHPREMTIVGTV